ncbi:hypothetical protein [Nocardia pseudobrasiliensis]|uniref:Aminotransferase class I and II n=1 Tax=Nocardia pseudobrasiliensis TaxID=45979 RepID=A0A370IBJ8_9NOCA|nr:hypothetical protein [Nocardia pseudobrasiliensis]RDI68092.1 hypothetical protein DFR76_102493 [Nocardia pseudobrasiliensis]
MAGFTVLTGDAVALARRMRSFGIHVVPMAFPVVPRGADRIRVQLSAAHSAEDVRVAVEAFQRARLP